MLGECVNRKILAESADYIIVNGCHNQLVGETAAPHTVLNVGSDCLGERRNVRSRNNVICAGREGVLVHHVGEGCRAVDFRDFRRRITHYIVKRIGFSQAKCARALNQLTGAEIAARRRKTLVIAEQLVHAVEQGYGVGNAALGLAFGLTYIGLALGNALLGLALRLALGLAFG